MEQNQFFALKIPFIEQSQDQSTKKGDKKGKEGNAILTIIGVIDASGSMSGCWEWLSDFWNQSIPKENLITITFDTRQKISAEGVLSKRIKDHGGGGTEIVPAFQTMETELQKVPIQNNITVIFISDGQDNNVRTIDERMKKLGGNTQNRNINFICLGVESGFPTNISMNLRQLYHRGDPQIPAIYLIEHASPQAFFNKFETMKKYFYPSQQLKLDRMINLFPYDEDVTDEVYEGQWIITKKNQLQILQEDKDPIVLQPIAESDLLVDDVVDLFRSWVQNLQIRAMSGAQGIKDKAADALAIMERIANRLSDQFNMNVLNFNQAEIVDPTQPFNVRAQRNYVYKYGNKLLFFIDEARQLAKGVDIKQLGDFEAAKKLNIGTITGKHQQKALALKGITVEEFRKMRDEFQDIVINCDFKKENEQGQERSVVSLETQRDIVSNSKLVVEGLKYIKSQYDFAETFPLVGHGLKVKRNDGCFVNPWLVQVENFAQQNKVIDSAYLIKNNFKVELNTGGEKKEEINCILPLFPQSDQDLQPILRSRIIKLLLTFMVQQNVDTFYEETYLALLANALIFVYKQPRSKWQEDTINLIYSTTSIVYKGTEKFENYLKKLLENPTSAYLEKEEQYEDYVATSKPFISLFYLMMTKNIVQDFESEIEKLILYHFIREQYKHQQQLTYYLKLKLEKQDEESLQTQLKSSFEKHVSIKHFRQSITQEIEQVILSRFENDNTTVDLYEEKVFNRDMKLTLEVIENFYEQFKGVKFDQKRYIHLIYHVIKTPENEVFTTKVNFGNIKDIQKELIQQNKGDLTKGTQSTKAALEKEYIVWFIKNHMMVKPLTYEELQLECQAKGIDVNTIAYNVKSGLSSNCCMSKQCPFYLIVNGLDYKRHIQTWGRKVPQGFHQYVRAEILKGQTLEQIIQSATQKWKKFPKLYLGNEDVVHQYIKMISESLPQEYQIKDLPNQQLLHHQVKLTFPQKQKVHKYGNKRGQQRGGRRGGQRGRGGPRGRGRGGRGQKRGP
ncbi:unnamed protein product (macronuclear) [Paramecium tetraurelia]|uniref:VWFA domain-containing protein n=1 Tax=Paramecium tetraurelia TaxID=5888 RepID=A0CK50_PARTE|nr:uncharacterized protein GSPATT00000880001 [Paramecium tetraurelia]CAK71167.1 unnamed protein product [Paramecium tetraurelia]|eukprot:XP_001438564.1 hypothetical protein (macronuclear) [Paramecium tetraurelia strain d4-2]